MQLTIEKMVYGGDGLARLPADERGPGKAVFVPFVLPGERVEVTLGEERAGFARAQATTIPQASPQRTDPPCPYFGRCGGCHYQHTSYEQQLEIKKEILRETFRRTAKVDLGEIEVHPSPPWNYRNRTRLRLRVTPEFELGYYRHGSHQLLPVEQCPISSPLIQRAIGILWKLGRAGKISAGLGEVELFANAEDTALLVELYMAGPGEESHKTTAEALREAMPEIVGVAQLRAGRPDSEAAKRVPADEQDGPVILSGSQFLSYRAGGHDYRVSAGSFFQTNRFLTDKLVELVVGGQSGRLALDLYAGTGLFAVALAGSFERVIAVESSQLSWNDLTTNVPFNIKTARATSEEYLEKQGRRRADLVVVDPPRGGLGTKVVRALTEMRPPQLVYVSCDPATLARDAQALLDRGYRILRSHLVDLFPQTFHIETVLHLAQ